MLQLLGFLEYWDDFRFFKGSTCCFDRIFESASDGGVYNLEDLKWVWLEQKWERLPAAKLLDYRWQFDRGWPATSSAESKPLPPTDNWCCVPGRT
jgi:hypothetical protein